MITKLTPEQEARFPEFVEKWTRIGLSTEPADRPMAEAAIRRMYIQAKLAAPKIVWTTSPMASALTRALLLDNTGQSVRDSVLDSVLDSVRASVRDSVRASVGDSVWASVGDSVRDSVRDSVLDSVWDSVWASVGDSVWDSVLDSVRDSVRDSVGASVRDSVYGQHDSSWLSHYDFLRIVCGLKAHTDSLCGLSGLAQAAGWAIPCKDICFVSERHNVLHRNARGQLHKDGGLACGYPDGWGVYALNGVRMNEKHVMTPAEQLDVAECLGTKNVEQRRELIRKIGIERCLEKLPHSVLSVQGTYELLAVDLSPEVKEAKFLKMVNPSIGCFHMEAVAPECQTVEHAINWRASENINEPWQPEKLT